MRVELLVDEVVRGRSFTAGSVVEVPVGLANRMVVAGIARRCAANSPLTEPKKTKKRKKS